MRNNITSDVDKVEALSRTADHLASKPQTEQDETKIAENAVARAWKGVTSATNDVGILRSPDGNVVSGGGSRGDAAGSASRHQPSETYRLRDEEWPRLPKALVRRREQ